MKLPEAVEWVERNYDRFQISVGLPNDGLCTVHWVSPADEPFLKWEDGRGPGHQQPMFNLKYDGGSYSDTYSWFKDDYVPLSIASEAAPL